MMTPSNRSNDIKINHRRLPQFVPSEQDHDADDNHMVVSAAAAAVVVATVDDTTTPVVVLPPSFVCPLTLQLMSNPVLDLCGHNFELTAIVDHVRQYHACPISNKPLRNADLRPNHILAERIERWQWQRDQQQHMRQQQQQQKQQQQRQQHNGRIAFELEPTKISRCRSSSSSSLDEMNDKDTANVMDLEWGDRRGQRHARRQQRHWHQSRMDSINSKNRLPVRFMLLLPQEIKALDRIEQQEIQQEVLEQHELCWSRVRIGTLIAVLILALIAFAIRLVVTYY